MTPILHARALHKTYLVPARADGHPWQRRRPSRLHAVDDVELTIMPGEAVGLVGESGCGKSTLARLISCLLPPDSGEILFDGAPLPRASAARFASSPLRRQIQMVFQDPTDSLNPRFTVFEAIADPVRQLLPRTGRNSVAQRVGEAALQVGLPHELFRRYPHQLSGGQKARVGIARAMAVGPRLLVLDEPTSALDVSVQALVLKLLVQLRRETGVAQLFVSHDLAVVRLICDRIAVMYLGKIVETGPAERIFRAPRHPYTRALLAAIPRLPGTKNEYSEAESLTGEPRSPIDPNPIACRLYGRCPRQTDFCESHPPELREITPGHEVRCHFPLLSASASKEEAVSA